METHCNAKIYKIISIFLFSFFLFFLTANSLLAINNRDDELAWKTIEPKIESFWRDYQTSPQRLKQTVWPLISMLKNFIKAYPNSKRIPEAYFILGETYSAVSYWPEAEAHWRIVIRYYPNSQWTNQALSNLIHHYEATGNQRKLRKFYKEIIRQFPDTIAAKTIKVILAKNLLAKGRKDIAEKVVKRIETSTIRAEVDVPELLDLKARLSLLNNRPQEAISYWLRYLNLTRSIAARASTLFSIAETYKKEGDYLKARKYYALIRRDYTSQPEYLFARFRMIQMDEEARKRLSQYTRGKVKSPDFVTSEMIFEKILKKFPRHPITREVKKEYVDFELQKGDYLKCLELANHFLKSDPENPYSSSILNLAKLAQKRLLERRYSTDYLKAIVAKSTSLLKNGLNEDIKKLLQVALNKKWIELQNQLLNEKRPLEAISEYWRYLVFFKPKNGTISLAKKALLAIDRSLLKKEKFEDLVNFYLFNKEKIDQLRVPDHYYYLARAYSGLNFRNPSLRAFYKAWHMGPSKSLRCPLLINWTFEVFRAERVKISEDTLALLDIYCPDSSMTSKILFLKSKLALWQGDYKAAFNMAYDSVSIKPEAQNTYQALRCGILLGKWDMVRKIFKENSHLLKKDRQRDILRFWGDEAYSLDEIKEARYAYNLLENLEKESPSITFRTLLVKAKQKGASKTIKDWKDLSKNGAGIWKKAAKAEEEYYKFIKGAEGSL